MSERRRLRKRTRMRTKRRRRRMARMKGVKAIRQKKGRMGLTTGRRVN
jgi:hypothetical protein